MFVRIPGQVALVASAQAPTQVLLTQMGPSPQTAGLHPMPALVQQGVVEVAAGADHDPPALAQVEPVQTALGAAGVAAKHAEATHLEGLHQPLERPAFRSGGLRKKGHQHQAHGGGLQPGHGAF